MKKIITVIICVIMLLSMAGCDQLEKLEAVELPPLPTASPEPSPVPTASPEPKPMEQKKETVVLSNQVIVNNRRTEINEYDPAKGEELILTYAYDTPAVYIDGRDEASSKINEYIAYLDESFYTGNNHGQDTATYSCGFNMMLELAQDNYSYVIGSDAGDIPFEYTASRTVSAARADSAVLSLVYSVYQYTGGAHGIYADRAYVFDTLTGEELGLDDISNDYDSFAGFLVEYMDEMAENDPIVSASIEPEFLKETENGPALSALLREGSWYFSDEGLVIFSDVYELGTYVQGMAEFIIPYSELAGKIDERFIPESRDGEAKLEIRRLEDITDGSTEICDLVVVDDDGEELCIIVEGTAYDVRISAVDYTDTFFETAQLWYTSYLQNSGVQIQCHIPEGMPKLMISCAGDNGETVRLLVSQSGKDGSPKLIREDISAVG